MVISCYKDLISFQDPQQYFTNVPYTTFNLLNTSPEYTLSVVYEKCVLYQNQIIFNGLRLGLGLGLVLA